MVIDNHIDPPPQPNQSPENISCTVTSSSSSSEETGPGGVLSVQFGDPLLGIFCKQWRDPENHDIFSFTVYGEQSGVKK